MQRFGELQPVHAVFGRLRQQAAVDRIERLQPLDVERERDRGLRASGSEHGGERVGEGAERQHRHGVRDDVRDDPRPGAVRDERAARGLEAREERTGGEAFEQRASHIAPATIALVAQDVGVPGIACEQDARRFSCEALACEVGHRGQQGPHHVEAADVAEGVEWRESAGPLARERHGLELAREPGVVGVMMTLTGSGVRDASRLLAAVDGVTSIAVVDEESE